MTTTTDPTLTAARHRYPQAEWITGAGRYAVLARCGVLTVTLHTEQAAATDSRAFIDQLGCGGGCSRRHEVIDLEAP
ncbi:hypothetical protein NF556_11580 [Ornithinimicrobium faecis]|uniref:Uncharacterized protein n=1 Tax=Ornithinimicrobium faecis TaxID=2934158 RepID=A0ABY4YNF4_9MICO|nr:hypothetical protein [Ornithinimicrobium sp. HY1793]USQ78294.1 hypothetical protein NF556_11580 [Ornithinimicrobium sp. HY1793]